MFFKKSSVVGVSFFALESGDRHRMSSLRRFSASWEHSGCPERMKEPSRLIPIDCLLPSVGTFCMQRGTGKIKKKHRKRIQNTNVLKSFFGVSDASSGVFWGNFPAAIRFPKTRRKLPKAHAQRMEAICRAVKSGVLRTGPVVFGWRSLAP